MPEPELLALALALAACAGLNTYLIAFLTGLAVRLEWWALPAFSNLGFLAEPWWMGVTGGLFLLEFAVDKVPRLNTWWNLPHTAVRTAGGFLITMYLLDCLGWGVAGGLIALVVHIAHADLRQHINRSPEPFSNVAASTARDLLVLGGFTLALRHPTAAGITAAAFAVACLMVTAGFVKRQIARWKKKPVAGSGSGEGES